jgi:hypothetical protein
MTHFLVKFHRYSFISLDIESIFLASPWLDVYKNTGLTNDDDDAITIQNKNVNQPELDENCSFIYSFI